MSKREERYEKESKTAKGRETQTDRQTDSQTDTRRQKQRDTEAERKREKNKYRKGTSDATASSSVIVSSFMMSFDDFLHLKNAIIFIQKQHGADLWTDGQTYRRTDKTIYRDA